MKRVILFLTFISCLLNVQARQPEKGYRGFFDSSNYIDLNLGFLAGEGGDSRVYTGFTTTHGYQFNSWLFAGGGAGMEYNLDWKSYGNNDGEPRFVIPLYAEGRLDAKWGRLTPFLSMRLGANLADYSGVYFSPTIGYRFNWGRKTAINLGFGATVIGRRYTYHEHIMLPEGGIILGDLAHYQGHAVKFTARLGLDF